MIDELTLAQINGLYICPPDAGPGWREAMEAGIDMSLLEYSLGLTPEERLEENNRVANFILEEAMIDAKQAAGRPRDLVTVRQLRAIKDRPKSK